MGPSIECLSDENTHWPFQIFTDSLLGALVRDKGATGDGEISALCKVQLILFYFGTD